MMLVVVAALWNGRSVRTKERTPENKVPRINPTTLVEWLPKTFPIHVCYEETESKAAAHAKRSMKVLLILLLRAG